MAIDAHKTAKPKKDELNTYLVGIKIKTPDAAILEHLNSQTCVSAYVKTLIREDIKNGNGNKKNQHD